MHDDLLDAQAALEWAKTQIPLLQQKFMDWNDCANPYRVVCEAHPDGTSDAVAVVNDQELPLVCNAWVGAIINSLRSSLDLVAAALARRNGKNPTDRRVSPNDRRVQFPIYRCLLSLEKGLDGEDWLSERELDAIKSFKPYRGGDEFLWPLHRLDNVRKHRRLIIALPQVLAFVDRSAKRTKIGGAGNVERRENKTILFRLKPSDTFDERNLQFVVRLMFDDMDAGMSGWEVPLALNKFAERVADVLAAIDAL